MIIPHDFELILKKVSSGISLKQALNSQGIDILDFFKHIHSNDAAMHDFEIARQISVEQFIDEMINSIDSADDKFELDKANLKISTTKWLAEKLIPKTYGAKINIDVHKTIDIRGILEDASKRVDYSVVDYVKVEDKRDNNSASLDEQLYPNILGENENN